MRMLGPMVGCWLLLGILWSESCAREITDEPRPLRARVEVDAHEECFTARFYLKNTSKEEIQVVYGRGSSGMTVVPTFHVGVIDIVPPTYTTPPRRSMKPNHKVIPPSTEILYGTFTMGYPPGGDKGMPGKDIDTLYATIRFGELKSTLKTETVPFPKAKTHKQP